MPRSEAEDLEPTRMAKLHTKATSKNVLVRELFFALRIVSGGSTPQSIEGGVVAPQSILTKGSSAVAQFLSLLDAASRTGLA